MKNSVSIAPQPPTSTPCDHEGSCGCPPTIPNARVVIGEGDFALCAIDLETRTAMTSDGRRAAHAFAQALSAAKGPEAQLFREELLELMMDDLATLEQGHEILDTEGTVE